MGRPCRNQEVNSLKLRKTFLAATFSKRTLLRALLTRGFFFSPQLSGLCTNRSTQTKNHPDVLSARCSCPRMSKLSFCFFSSPGVPVCDPLHGHLRREALPCRLRGAAGAKVLPQPARRAGEEDFFFALFANEQENMRILRPR